MSSSSPPTTPSPPPLSPISGDEKPDRPPPPTRTPSFPSRDDCWSEPATRTLIDAWGSQYVSLNRGNLRQKHWQEVAGAVNALHGASFRLRRTDVQCKNRIDTVKKKYKIEKIKAAKSKGRYKSTWPHFDAVDSLIGDALPKPTIRRRISPSPESLPPAEISRRPIVSWSVPVGPRSKRGSVTERNFSVMAAAAAALAAKEEDSGDDEDYVRIPATGKKRKTPEEDPVEGYRILADAITSLGRIYERVEASKQRQMVELEKQRMQFTKDLEIERMKVFVESRVQMEKMNKGKNNSNSNSISNSQSNSYL